MKDCLYCEKKFNPIHKTSKFCSHSCSSRFYTSHFRDLYKGKPKSLEIRLKFAEAHKFENKGDKVSYRNLHRWVERWRGKPTKCESCGKIATGKHIQWANKSRKYLRELSDWIRLCASCHRKYDLGKA